MNIIRSPKQKKFLAMKRRGLFDASAKDPNMVRPKGLGGPKTANPFTPNRKNLFKL